MRSLVGALVNRAPVPYTPSSGRLSLPLVRRRGATANMEAYGSVPTLFAIVHRTSTDTGKVEWKLWRKAASGKKEDRTEVTSHAALDLWNRPNPFYTRREFVETVTQHRDLTGEGIWVIGRDPRSPLPLELWPVRPDRMEPVPHPRDFLAGWVYTGPDGEKVPLDVADVMQIKMPNPLDPYRGMGPVQALLVDLDSSRYSAEWNRNFFINSAEPGGLIKVDKRLSDDEFQEMRDRWNEQHKGVAAAHRVAVLEQGEWVDRKFTMRDMQFAELRKVSRDIILEGFGMSKTMIGAAESETNRATAEAAEYVYSKYQLTDRLDHFKGVLNTELLGLYGPQAVDTLEFDYPEDVVPENAEAKNAERDSKVQAAVAMVNAGWDPAEVLESLGLPEVTFGLPGSDPDRDLLTKLVQGAPSLAPLILPMLGFDLPETPAAPAPAVPAAPAPAALLPARHDRALSVPSDRTHGPWAATQAEQLRQVQQDWERALNDLLETWTDITAEQRRQLVDQIRRAVDEGDTEALAALSVDTGPASGVLEDAMLDLTVIAADRMVAEADDQGVDIDPVPGDEDSLGSVAFAVAAMLGAGLALSAGREAIRVLGPDSTGDDVAEHVGGYLAGLSDATPRDLLGGALTSAQNAGRINTLRAAPSAAYYANETLDRNTCVNCRDVDGKWLGNDLEQVDEVYPTGGYVDCLGRERCRGTVVAEWPREAADGD